MMIKKGDGVMKSKWISDIPGLEHVTGYKVYEDGSVKSFLKRHCYEYVISDTPRKTLKPMITRKNYAKVELKGKGYFVHRLVALAFIDNPESKEQVNHIDGDKLNNDVSNLEWCTQSENQIHNVKLGLHKGPKGENHYAKKYKKDEHHACKTILQLDENKRILNRFKSVKSASEHVGIHTTAISKALNGQANTSGGFFWAYDKP